MDGQNYSDFDKNSAETPKANTPFDEPKQPQAFVGYDLFEDDNYLNANELQMLEWDPKKMQIICPDPF
jgi:hypothetical protein